MKIQTYDGTGPREDMLKWLQSLISYFTTKEDMTVAEKFQTVSLCLSSAGSLQNQWADAETGASGLTYKIGEGTEDETEEEIAEDAQERFEQAMLRFFQAQGFDRGAGGETKRYMQNCMRKPFSLEPRDMFSRLEAMNKYFQYMPQKWVDESVGEGWLIGVTPLTESELKHVAMYMIPEKWRSKMLEANMKADDLTLQEVMEYMNQLQKASASDHVIPKNKTGNGKGRKDKTTDKNGRTNKHQKGGSGKNGNGRNRSAKFCAHCKFDLKNDKHETHNTVDCWFKDKEKSGNRHEGGGGRGQSSRDKGGSWKKRNAAEMNSIAKAAVKEYISSKKKSKIRKKFFSVSSDESGSDSDSDCKYTENNLKLIYL